MSPGFSFILRAGPSDPFQSQCYRRSPTGPKGNTGTPHQTFIGHSGAVMAAVQTGETLVTADASDGILFWRCNSAIPAVMPSAQDDMAVQENVSSNLPSTAPRSYEGVLHGPRCTTNSRSLNTDS